MIEKSGLNNQKLGLFAKTKNFALNLKLIF